jgi:hypothetical protein
LEAGNLLARKPLLTQFWISAFQSVTARTAGFNTINLGRCGPDTLFLIMVLMFIGASPGGTGGGVLGFPERPRSSVPMTTGGRRLDEGDLPGAAASAVKARATRTPAILSVANPARSIGVPFGCSSRGTF